MNTDFEKNEYENASDSPSSVHFEKYTPVTFIRTNILFFINAFFVIFCIVMILLYVFAFYNKNLTEVSNTAAAVYFDDTIYNDIHIQMKDNKKSEDEKAVSIDAKTLGEMYALYNFERIVRPEYFGLLYDIDNDNAEEFIYEKNTEYFFKKYNGKRLVTTSFLPPNTLLTSFKKEEFTEECQRKAEEYGYPKNDGFTIIPECSLIAMTNIKSEIVYLREKPHQESRILQELPKGLFLNCLFFYDNNGNFTSDGAYNGTYSWSEVMTNYNGTKIRGFVHADDLILNDKIK